MKVTTTAWKLELSRGRFWTIGSDAAIVGILNCTPDSFSDGGLHADRDSAIEAGLRMLAEGADSLDVGGESTRPGATPVSPREQIRRIVPVIRGLRAKTQSPLSVDTMSPEVAAAALEAGADLINDVAGLRDPGWKEVVASSAVPVIVGHMQGTPQTMQDDPQYPGGVVDAVRDFFQERLETLGGWGVAPERVLLDPGIGFGKSTRHNVELLAGLRAFHTFERPVYVGVSRKGFIAKILGPERVDRDVGTLAAHATVLFAGAHVLRVHNVPFTRALVTMWRGVREAGGWKR